MSRVKLLEMLARAYEMGLNHGITNERAFRSRPYRALVKRNEEWTKYKDACVAEYDELVTL